MVDLTTPKCRQPVYCEDALLADMMKNLPIPFQICIGIHAGCSGVFLQIGWYLWYNDSLLFS